MKLKSFSRPSARVHFGTDAIGEKAWGALAASGRSADFQICCIAGFQTRLRFENPTRRYLQTPCRFRNRRYSRLGSLRYERRAGFTLIEIVIGASLMSLILVAAYLCLNAGLSSQKVIEPRAEVIQNARVAMALITADLRGACPLSKDYAFLGVQRTMDEVEGDSIDFATHNYTPRRPREGDYCQESLFVDKNPQTGQFSLWRRRNPVIALDPLSGGAKEEIATGVVGLRFEYFDGLDWYPTWGEIKKGKKETTRRDQPNLDGMPSAVRVTLLLDSNPKSKAVSETGERVLKPPMAFQTVVSLELAANELNKPAAASANSDNSDSTDQQDTSNGGSF